MKNIVLMLAILLGASGVATLCGVDASLAGRIGIAAVFAFTAFGHFVKRDEMAAMIPPCLPWRTAIVVMSGFLEVFLAALVLLSNSAKPAGIALCTFLVVVTPLNIYAAVHKVDFGGHAAGPRYLGLRLPLQVLLLGWTYWFAVHLG